MQLLHGKCNVLLMDLKTYLKRTNQTPYAFCRDHGFKRTMVYYILHHQRRPSPRMASRIERATGGAVTRLELLYPDD